MPELRIYHSDALEAGPVTGPLSRATWGLARDGDVQAVALMVPYPVPPGPWSHTPGDRQLWTGEPFDPRIMFGPVAEGWPVKEGLLLPDEAYFAIWERARADG